MEQGVSCFDTALGVCGIAWQASEIVGVALPARDVERTRATLRARCPDAVERAAPDEVRAVIAAIDALLRGEHRDLLDVRLCMASVPEFARRVYAAARTIPPGSTSTYGALAATVGEPGAARAVGHALGTNPFPIIVPCHRVLAADGSAGGFSAPGGTRTKLRMLEIEGGQQPALFEL